MRSAEKKQVLALLSIMWMFPVTEIIARRDGEFARQYRHSHTGISIPDYLIAATAENSGTHLATLNLRRSPMFPDLKPPFDPSPPAR
jgi:predicted nucleic acid-binding protein